MDEDINQYNLYLVPAYQKIKIGTLMSVFDQVHKDIRLKPIMSAQLAKRAMVYIPKFQIVNQIQDVVLQNSTLMEAVHNAYIRVTNQ